MLSVVFFVMLRVAFFIVMLSVVMKSAYAYERIFFVKFAPEHVKSSFRQVWTCTVKLFTVVINTAVIFTLTYNRMETTCLYLNCSLEHSLSLSATHSLV